MKRAGAIAALLALTMFVAPTVGSTREELVQDTLKSAIVAFAALYAAFLFFWARREEAATVRWHPALALPLLPMAHALGSMGWSHTYLAAVEAIRWFLFAVLMALALNTVTRQRLPLLAAGIVAGGVGASTWAVAQFLFDFSFFPQGPPPASTFVNRNFFAEFAICTVPFAVMLAVRAKQRWQVLALSLATALIVVAIMMTGTRAALASLWLLLAVVFPLVAWRFRSQFPIRRWASVLAIAAVAVLAIGSLPTRDTELAAEGHGVTALERAFKRTAAITPGDSSLSIRKVMWRATGRMIAAHPLAGVGAGAWENEVPLYQSDGAQLETDFYVHNEYLQLFAEYGVVGWLFLAALAAWLLRRAAMTWREPDAEAGAWSATLLASLLALFIVSNVGFAWRLASTGALFALCLGALAAFERPREIVIRPAFSLGMSAVAVAAIGLAAHITLKAVEAEAKLVRASRIAITLSGFENPNDPRWNPAKAEMLALLQEGIRINPHYRKLTPLAADALARWGDWNNAIWVWESVLASRPNIVAILTNVARGYIATGRPQQAAEYIERARRIQPDARSVRSAEVLLLARTGREAEALEKGREAMAQGLYDNDLTNAVIVLGRRLGDNAIADEAIRLRAQMSASKG